ncbi:MAG: RdgB/HAM1 family non-canonical purine NTP pyrophosphatase [Alphaproteobacteria bacterium]|nr:RdgB/HAM1 family non-canonical purine NTP pyrophosphatase [Alphaproteobacteria bacterium]
MRTISSPLLLASHNQGKLVEIRDLLKPYALEVISAAEKNVSEPEETGASFAENAALKALHSAKATGLIALADDSGLSVAGLDGAPGIYSARWAGERKDFAFAMQRVHDELAAKSIAPQGAAASFICNLALGWPDGYVEHVEGEIKGTLTFPPRGDKGFGYDPIFIPEGYDVTFAEMDANTKHRISHRGRAFALLAKRLAKEAA